ncbi:M28 family metallopeptidase [Siphonobacter sp. SORGH_AS_0500]|uniref:M28 family metallopeptidase n=1 Tax=Siphonobacter sp. SORGH_AS_0500 TaxID=1864824 RepID=UPI0018E3AAF5|nr:M28 family metallopeptidase [Siphonobacter sp. SORGH_AS_0500]
MFTRVTLLFLLSTLSVWAQKPTSIDSLITARPFTEYVKHLSSDAFEGRKPFSHGEEVTVKYLETEFKKMGLKPGNNQSYFQDVPLVDILSKPSVPLKLATNNKELKLNYLTDFVAASRWTDAKVSLENSEMVFVGYGIVAPEFGWNDYQGLNVKGKTVLVLVNDPGLADSTLFKGKTMTYYGRWTYKFEEAARQGAAGVLLIHDTKAASYPWDVVRSGWSKSKLYLQSPDNNHSRAKVEGWLSKETTEKLLAMAGKSTDLYQQAAKRGFKPVPLGVKASIALDNQVKTSVSKNVLAYLPGTDRAEEVVIYTAHWDHFGKGEPINGDSIYNGAADNGTGVAAIMELAKAFTQLKKNHPARFCS